MSALPLKATYAVHKRMSAMGQKRTWLPAATAFGRAHSPRAHSFPELDGSTAGSPQKISTSGLFMRELDRQNKLEQRPIFTIRRRSQLTAMMFDNHSTDCQSQAHAVRLRREKCTKYAVEAFWINSRPGISHRHSYRIPTTERGCHPQYPIAICRRVHCFDRVVNQVKDDLFQLPPMALDKRQFGRHLKASLNAMILQLSPR